MQEDVDIGLFGDNVRLPGLPFRVFFLLQKVCINEDRGKNSFSSSSPRIQKTGVFELRLKSFGREYVLLFGLFGVLSFVGRFRLSRLRRLLRCRSPQCHCFVNVFVRRAFRVACPLHDVVQ